MKKPLLALLFFFMAINICTAQDALPTVPAKAKTIAGFIPRGWSSSQLLNGDLNKDSLADAAILLKNEQQFALLIALQHVDGTYSRSFYSTFSSIEYISKLTRRNNTLLLQFDLPSYTAGHFINVISRYQNNNWMIIGYSEETYEDNDTAAKSKVVKWKSKDVNLITGDTNEYNLAGTKKKLIKKYKQKTEPLINLKDIDKLPVMNW